MCSLNKYQIFVTIMIKTSQRFISARIVDHLLTLFLVLSIFLVHPIIQGHSAFILCCSSLPGFNQPIAILFTDWSHLTYERSRNSFGAICQADTVLLKIDYGQSVFVFVFTSTGWLNCVQRSSLKILHWIKMGFITSWVFFPPKM